MELSSATAVRRDDSFPFKGKAGMGMVLLWCVKYNTNTNTNPTSILPLKGRRQEHHRSMGPKFAKHHTSHDPFR